jgi:bifunctional DNA-binding transcriptional regulator/antitoxin component of YhaV-PrlF toxin-antitoxin module
MEKVIMAGNGRLVVPASLRQQLGMAKGGRLVASIRDGALVFEPFDIALRRLQDQARAALGPGDGLMSDELIADRRREAAKEEADG